MKILWFPRLQFDIDKLHITTWREMCKEIGKMRQQVCIAIAGKYVKEVFEKEKYISIFIVRRKYLRIISFYLGGFFKFVLSCYRFKPDVIILDLYSIWFSLPFLLIPRKTKPTIIVDNRTPFYNTTFQKASIRDIVMRFYTKVSYLYCKSSLDGMTVITDYYKEQVCKTYKFNPSTIGVWGSGVNVEAFSIKKNKDTLSILKDKFVLMQHGEISYNRGIFEVVRALNLIKKNDVCLLLVGDQVGGSKAKEELLVEVKKLNLDKNVFVLPPVPHSEVPKYISCCNVAILAYPNIEYWNNNNPIKLLEYLAMGKSIICTDMWTFRNVMGNNKCVHYIKDNNPITIAEAINYYYKNRIFLADWGKTGIDIVKSQYTWSHQALNLLSFIELLQGGKTI